MDERIIELQTRLAYQEQLGDDLSAELAAQQVRLTQLERLNQELLERFRVLASALPVASADDQPPPHY